ncbi:hypothetical protein, partial [Demequina sp. NBRC 110051]|uniref:hypothetical protein n=1 Tax=Demequina sp. NBRC 110051 TaxID=1570340 RepID=UPI00117E4EAB
MDHVSSNDADRDFDALVAGRPVTDPDLAALAPAFAALRASAAAQPTDSQAEAMVATLAAAVAPAAVASTAGARPAAARRSTWRRRVGASVAVAGVLGLGLAGAAAADDAAPGDALYGVDRALERVGINAGGADERLGEVRILVERGDVDRAAALATETLDSLDETEAADGLRVAAESVLAEGSEQSLETRTRVSEMLLWMADQDERGAAFGKAVSERARGLVDTPAVVDDATVEPQDGDAGGADEGSSPDVPVPATAGQSETAGQPAEAGDAPVSAGQGAGTQEPSDAHEAAGADVPSESGKPADAGKPEGTGKPEGAGKPEGTGKPEGAGKPEQETPTAESGDADASAKESKPAGEVGKP